MKTDDFDFDLPSDLIAQRPVRPRDRARLLVAEDGLADRAVHQLPELLRPGDLLVVNDTRVIPVRLVGRRRTAKIEVTLHKAHGGPGGGTVWSAFARPARKLAAGDRIEFADDLAARVDRKLEAGEVVLAFDGDEAHLAGALERHGAMPLPPYIRRPSGGETRDRDDYQTIFAKRAGAVAAPTSGLHFTPALLRRLGERGVESVKLTLHVGAGTFLPVKTEDPRQHRIHSEFGELGEESADRINRARAAGRRILAVGTTVLRLLESAADAAGRVAPFKGETDLFILPGYRIKTVDLLLTNFHLPRSTLFMLVCAFAGHRRMLQAYAHARREGYRFYSYGDACLLSPEPGP